LKNFLLGTLVLLILQACSSYKQNIMFQKEAETVLSEVSDEEQMSRNYEIQPNDRLEIEVYTKKGEFLIDPENRLLEQQRNINNNNIKPQLQYLVQIDSTVVLPMVGQVNLAGLTLNEAEKKLIEDYSLYYKDPFVKLRYVNKRVIVLGAAGGRVIPIANENTTVVEILAMMDEFESESKSHNIRLLRDDRAYILDFSTITGYQKNNMVVENGDVIYVEPVRRPFTEFVRDNGPVISIFSSLASLVAIIISINN